MKRQQFSSLIFGTLLFLGGVGLGGGIVFFWMGDNSNKVLKIMATGQTLEALEQARLLREGNADQVLSQREKSLELAVNWYRAFQYEDADDIRMLYLLKDYRDKWKVSMEPKLSSYLDTLPPRPAARKGSCPAPIPAKKS